MRRRHQDLPTFHDQYVALADLEADGVQASGLQTRIVFNRAGPGRIAVEIEGVETKAAELRALMKAANGPCQFRAGPLNCGELLESQHAWLMSVGGPGMGHEDWSGRIADVRLDELHVRRDLSGEHSPSLSYCMAGPRNCWTYSSSRDYDENRNAVEHIEPMRIACARWPYGALSVAPWELEDVSDVAGRKVRVSTSLPVVKLDASAKPADLAVEKLVEQGDQLVRDLEALGSFACRRTVRWYERSVVAGGYWRTIRDLGTGFVDSVDMDQQSIGRQHLTEFLENGLAGIARLRRDDVELLPVIFSLVAGHEAHLLEPKFMTFFVALEGLVSLHDTTNPVGKADQKAIRRELDAVLDGHHALGDTREWIKAKIPELWRPPFRDRLLCLLRRYDISETRLEESGQETVYASRNRLFHTAAAVPVERLVLHTYVVRDVVEQLVIKMLGCTTDHLVQWYSPAWRGRK